MKIIDEELKRVEKLQDIAGDDFFILRKYKKDLEWWILAMTKNIFKKEQIPFPNYAIDIEKNGEPDFQISFDGIDIYKKVEITEVLAPGRKRSEEYKILREVEQPYIEEVQQINNPWSSFNEVLENKFMRNFGENCWLIIYHNMLYNQITSYGFWHETVLKKAPEWNTAKHNYERILVINNSGKAAVSIFPYFFIIRPQFNSSGVTKIDRMYIRNYDKEKSKLLI